MEILLRPVEAEADGVPVFVGYPVEMIESPLLIGEEGFELRGLGRRELLCHSGKV